MLQTLHAIVISWGEDVVSAFTAPPSKVASVGGEEEGDGGVEEEVADGGNAEEYRRCQPPGKARRDQPEHHCADHRDAEDEEVTRGGAAAASQEPWNREGQREGQLDEEVGDVHAERAGPHSLCGGGGDVHDTTLFPVGGLPYILTDAIK